MKIPINNDFGDDCLVLAGKMSNFAGMDGLVIGLLIPLVGTVLGAAAGGLLGNQVQNQQVDRRDGQSVFVQLHNGVTIAVTQVANPDLYVGQPVYVEGAGQSARVIPRH